MKKIIFVLTTVFSFFLLGNNLVRADNTSNYNNVYNVATSKLGSPYTFGATGPDTFDCSGYLQYIFSNGMGASIGRNTQDQYENSTKIDASQAQPGDIVFFGSDVNNIYHDGMYIGNNQMIDAQNNGVVIENIYAPWWNVVAFGRPEALSNNNNNNTQNNSNENQNSSSNKNNQSNQVNQNEDKIKQNKVKYKKINKKMVIDSEAKSDFYNHIQSDTRYTARLKMKSSRIIGQEVSVNNRGTDVDGNIYYRCKLNNRNIGWVDADTLRPKVTYKNVDMYKAVSYQPKNNFYNYVTQTRLDVKRTYKSKNYVGKILQIDQVGYKDGFKFPYYHAKLNNKDLGWIYGKSLLN
ncbi:hypothetical protein GSH19_00845 [Lactobacillus sp. S2-2]|uniref:C40 family peptidase n=1 Tax=Lactobacillus sp. S2-2 TaxID=2692917 RepID=UPI001F171A42|nr:NlpC/P60 family protein [Lactobacillus sp. S2-2]MCF6514735.1 hypothetical protein [Lactobacillus sp. S2-2]